VRGDLGSGLAGAVGVTPAGAPEATVSGDIAAELAAQDATLVELHIDRACLAATMVGERGEDLAVDGTAWRVGNAGRLTTTDFRIDFDTGQLTCPNDVVVPVAPGRSVHFPTPAGAACPLRVRCTTSSTGRRVAVHPTRPCWWSCASVSRPPTVARACVNAPRSSTAWPTVGSWQGRRARYLGPRTSLFDLRRVAVVDNLHVIACQPPGSQQAA
jgi:hypothetical protein